MKPFHVIVRALPTVELQTAPTDFDGASIETLLVPSTLQSTPLGISFEVVADELESLPRMFFEPDGSFVWVSAETIAQRWQVDGNLYDRDGSLVAVDLKGICDLEHLTRLLNTFRAEDRRLMIEVVTSAVFVHEADFLELFC